MRPHAFALAIALTACGSTDETCPHFDGVYLTEYDEISGDCGALPDDLATYDPADDAAPERPGCDVRHERQSDDRCDLELDVECPEDFADGTSGTVRRVASLHKEGAESAWGTLELRLEDADGARICRSVYDVLVTRR